MNKCPYCGRDNEDKALNCSHCFAGLPTEKKEEKEAEKPQKQGVKKHGT